jgi:diguanylate cyclase (GGDEF)-like protein
MDLFFPRDDPQRPQIDLLLAEARRAGSTEIEGWAVKRDGSRIWESTVITALPDEAGTVRGFVVVSRDLTERKRLEDATLQLASRDPLTGAYNRRQGDALIEAEFGRRARYGRPFALLMIDIDHFKAVNDRFGHGAGDAVLVALVQTCGDALRPSDVVVRWGGDEFLVLLPETDPTAAASAAERLRAILAHKEHAGPDGAPVSFTVCIGAASPTSDDPRDLLRRVDIALYAAKAAGRNRVMLAP